MITVYAITNYGEGYAERIGTFDTVEDVQIRIGMFADDVLVTFEETRERREEDT